MKTGGLGVKANAVHIYHLIHVTVDRRMHEEQLITNLEESTGHGGLRSYGYPAF